VIEVTGLVKRHGEATILDGISLVVRKGEVAAVIGPSGGGKSTLLRCLNGLESFEAGRIRVGDVQLGPDGGNSSGVLQVLRRRLGMVFQQFHLFPHLTVLENVCAGPCWVLDRPREEAEASARALLERVGLGDKLAARPETLSGGQQQRVAIARALAMRPGALLCDEPTSALDPRMAAEVTAVMAELARDGQTMVVVTHAMGFARKVAHTVHVMHAGRVAESGPPDQVFASPREAVTREFLAGAKEGA
jgi:ABC-type polar amino acid transport system ATPase subunit